MAIMRTAERSEMRWKRDGSCVLLVALMAGAVSACAPCRANPAVGATMPVLAAPNGLPCTASLSGTIDGSDSYRYEQFVSIEGQRNDVDVTLGETHCTFAARRESDGSGVIAITCDAPSGTAQATGPIAQLSLAPGQPAATLRCAPDAHIDVH